MSVTVPCQRRSQSAIYRTPHQASHTRTGHSHTAAAAEYIDAGSECASRQARRLMIWAVMSGGLEKIAGGRRDVAGFGGCGLR